MIHGSGLSVSDGKRINHAWCERGEVVLDLARPVGARIVERALYYRLVQAKVCKVYSSDDAVQLAIKNRHDGPWDESEQLKE